MRTSFSSMIDSSFLLAAALTAAAGLAAIVYLLCCRILHYKRKLHEVGYACNSRDKLRETANRVRRMRKLGHVPPVFPNGWYYLMHSSQLRINQAATLHVVGKHITVFRDTNSIVHAVHAYCPHFGADLGAGGRVIGDCIECPFHGWKFRGSDGTCVEIPALQKGANIPEKAKLDTYIINEVNSGIYFWFDAEGRDPHWNLPIIDGIADGSWSQKGETEHFVNCHIEEINQNGADIAHLSTVHDPSFFSGTDLRYIFRKSTSFLWQNFTANWKACSDEGMKHLAVMDLHVQTFLFGCRLKFVEMRVKANQLGPAVVYLEFNSIFGPGVFIHCVTPVEPLVQKVHHSIFMRNWVPSLIPTIYLSGEAFQFERDIMIWNNKQFKDKPVLARSQADSFMQRHRRWYSQFYSQNSPSLRDALDQNCDW